MKPYYDHAGITIYHGDCRELLPHLRVDAIVSDVPYGMNNNTDYTRFSSGNGRRGVGKKHPRIVGDDTPFDPGHVLSYKKIILWGANHYWNKLPPGGCLVWIKRNAAAFNSFLSDAEVAFESGISGVYCFTRVFSGSSRAVDAGFSAYESSAHPSQKPVELMRWCLSRVHPTYSLCDPYMGSGTTLVAAKSVTREAIGIEIEERYCEVAAKRLSQEVMKYEEVTAT